MSKKCVICDAIFEPANRRANACSEECRRERKRRMKREEKKRYYARYPHKKREQYARYINAPGKREMARARDLRRDDTARALRNLSSFTVDISSHVANHARAAVLPAPKYCVVCGSPFHAVTKTKTCSDECWLENRRRVRSRPETRTDRTEMLAKKREYQNRLNDERAAALQLIREIEEKGIEALL